MKKDIKNSEKQKKENVFVQGLVSTFFEMIKHFIRDFETMKKAKKVDRVSEEFSTLEHMIIKLEKKLEEQHHKLNELKNRILWGNIVIIVLIVITLYHIIK